MLCNSTKIIRLTKRFYSVLGTSKRESVAQENILKSPYADVEIPRISLPDYLWKNVDKWEDKTALVCSVTGRSYTFDQAYKRCKNVAKALKGKLRFQKGDTLAIFMPNAPEYTIAEFGTIQAGLILTTVNPIYTPSEISKQFLNSGVKAVFTLNELVPTVQEALKLSKKSVPIIAIKNQPHQSTPEGVVNFQELMDYDNDIDLPQNINVDDVVLVLYSSGTTGLPKGVQITHSTIVSNLCQMSHPENKMELDTTGTHQDVVPVLLPLYHIYGQIVVSMKSLSLGCKTVTIPKFNPDSFTATVRDHKATILYLAPPTVIFMGNYPSVTPDHLKTLRIIFSGAAPLGALDAERILNKSPKETVLKQSYGMTETSTVLTMVPITRNDFPLSSVGFIVPNTEGKVVNPEDPNHTPLGPKQNGELFVKGPQVMKGYYNNPKANEEIFVDGWLRTGDLVYYDEHQKLFVTDRLKELIKVKGLQVAPAELEEVLRDHPDVNDAAVFGVPHPQFGEAPRAALVPKPGKTIKPDKIQEYVASKLAKYKHLSGGIMVVDAIPKNPSGKILRRTLKTMYLENK